ncbi:MAG: heparinase II/III family protein, partial [Clostridia bacterium]|nr:heparinase II/III family protein [Clostridia bacterium]
LETGERLNRWVDIVDAFLETDVFDTRIDEFCNILSFMWGDCNYLAGLDISNGSYWWSNWRIVANAGFFKAVEYIPEFSTHDTWRDKVEYNVEYTFDLLYNSDYSFTEAGPSYAAWCVKLFGDCLKAADMSGNPMSAVFREKVKYATRNALESYYPDGYDSNIGDSNYRDQMHYFEMLNEVFGGKDAVINSYVSGQDKGAEYLTRYYDTVNSAYMRNSWNPEEAVYINFTNNPADGHYHPDSNQVLMYAYGSPLLVDSGRYSYSSTNSIYDTLRTAASHNTIEADGLTLGAHSAAASANALTYANSNSTFDFATSTQNGYTDVAHTRNVFFSRSGFGIVTDYVEGSSSRAYRQNWHFMPSSNATVSGNVASTAFYNAPDITLAAASADSASIKSGYHSADYGLVAESEYASFQKSGTTVKFDTVLYPDKANIDTAVTATDLAASDTSKAAIEITIDGKTSYYYVKNTSSSNGTFGSYTTDAKMAYVSDTEYMIADGKKIEGKIESGSTIISMGVTMDNGTVTINGEKLVADSDSATAIKIYAPNATTVIFNGEEVSFTKSGNYIYAVASAVGESVTGAVAKVYPDKDGFYSYASGNEGTSNTTIIQAALSSWNNRNAYMAYDLSDFADKEITNVTLNMKMYENASAGNMHFYYLDYGTWTRSNLSFVLDSSKMPSHGTSSGAGFTGYSYRWSGSASDVAVNNWVQFTTNFPQYLAANDNYKFTWAMLSESGSAKYYALAAAEANRPYLEVTYNYQTSSEGYPTVTIREYRDGVLYSTETDSGNLGEVYLYEAEDTITSGDATYFIDAEASKLSAVVAKSDNVIEVYYKSAETITVSFEDILGNTLTEDVIVSISPTLGTYTYPAPATIEKDNSVYTLDTSLSNISCVVGEDSTLTAVYRKTSSLGENLIYNGDMSETTTADGYTYVTGWQGGYVNGEHQALSNRPDIYLHSSKGAGSTTDSHFIYTAATDSENAYVTTPARSTMTSSDWGAYPWKSDVSEPYMAFVLTSWMKDANDVNSYLKAEKGKTYYMSFDIKATSIASVNNVVGFTAVSVNGDNYATKIPGTNGDINTLTWVLDNSIGRNRYLTTADEWVTISTTATATADGYFMFQLGWAHEYGQVSVGNFKICEVQDFEYVTVSLDGEEVITEGTIELGENGKLPDNVMGYTVTSGDTTKLVNAGTLEVSDGDIITTTGVNVSIVTGAQVRIGNGVDANGKIASDSGLRFIAQIDRSYVDDEKFTYGMEITAEGSDSVTDVPAKDFQNDDDTIFTVAITNLAESNFNREFTATAYVDVTYSDGTTARIRNTQSITRSIYQVSVGLMKNGTNGIENSEDNYSVSETGGLYAVLNAYVNMVGVRITLFLDGSVSVCTEGAGAYSGDVFFDVTCIKNGNVYTITITPLTEGFTAPVELMDYWQEFIRINNNNSVVSENISNVTSSDGSITFDFTDPTAE